VPLGLYYTLTVDATPLGEAQGPLKLYRGRWLCGDDMKTYVSPQGNLIAWSAGLESGPIRP
jgi:hypothetical protein